MNRRKEGAYYENLVAEYLKTQGYEILEKNGCDVTFLVLEGADHADLQFFQDEVWERMISFFKKKLTRICQEEIKS